MIEKRPRKKLLKNLEDWQNIEEYVDTETHWIALYNEEMYCASLWLNIFLKKLKIYR